LRARARLVDKTGVSHGSRDLASDTDDCARLVAALALAISIALDPMIAASAAPGRVALAVGDSAPSVEPSPKSPASHQFVQGSVKDARPGGENPSGPAASSRGGYVAHVGAGAFATMGWLLQASAGLSAAFRLAISLQWSTAIEGQVELPT